MDSYIEHAIQKYFENSVDLGSSVHTRREAFSNGSNRNHAYSENPSVELGKVIESNIRDKVKEYVDKKDSQDSTAAISFIMLNSML